MNRFLGMIGNQPRPARAPHTPDAAPRDGARVRPTNPLSAALAAPPGDLLRPAERTPLAPTEERAFRDWARRRGIADPDDPRELYDYRGAFATGERSTINDADGLPHWPDRYKQHGHPTFSVESQYSAGPFDGGFWRGETFFPQARTAADSAEARDAWKQARRDRRAAGRAHGK